MATEAQLAAAGSGVPIYALAVPGLGVFTSRPNWFPFASAYGNARHFPWLNPWTMPDIREQIDPIEGALEVEDISIDIVDVDAGMTALVRDWRARGYAYLQATMTASQTYATIDDVTWASAGGGFAWCEQECWEYTGVPGYGLTGLTRGALGTIAAAHTVDLTAEPPRRPLVTDGLHTLINRRALLYRSAVDDEGIGAPTCIYRGRIVGYRAQAGTWTLDVEHLSAVLQEECCATLPQSELHQGYWISGNADRSTPKVMNVIVGGTMGVASTPITAGWKWNAPHLATAWNTAVRADSLPLEPRCTWDDEDRVKYAVVCDDADINTHIQIDVFEGDPLWCLGFDPGMYIGEDNTPFKMSAQNEPRRMVVDLRAGTALPEVIVEDPSVFTHGLYVASPKGPWIRCNSTVDDAKRMILDRWWDESYGDYWEIEDEEDMVLQHVLAHGTGRSPSTLLSTVYTLLGVGTGDESDSWFPQILQAADVDTDEWAAAMSSVPPELSTVRGLVITRGTKIWDIIGPHLGILGVFPRVTTSGKIGAVRIGTPVPSMLVDVAVDSAMWSLDHATEIGARVEHSALLNVVVAEHSYDYWKDSFSGTPLKAIFDDGLNTLGSTRSITYPLRGLRLTYWTEVEMWMALNAQVTPTHFGQYGRASTILDVACGWTAKQMRCGDYCLVSHDLAPDTVLGAIGMTDRPALIIGRTASGTGQEPDGLLLQVYPAMTGAGIAPCARALGYNTAAARLQLSVSDAYAQADATDLDWLDADVLPASVQMTARGVSTSPPTVWNATVSAVSGVYVLLKEDVFSTGFPSGGVYLTLPDWDLALTWQKLYAYSARNLTVPKLGTSADAAKEWTI